jgi:glycosyltransferase involved in cell wall biosynthesis
MVHFQAELANALIAIVPTVVVCSAAAPASLICATIPRITLATGSNRSSSLARAASPLTWYRLVRALRAAKVDVIHVVGVHEWNSIVAVLTKILGATLVYTMHDPEAHRGTSLLMRVSNWISPRLADAIVVLTRTGRDELVANGFPAPKIYHIPHGAYSFFARWRRARIRRGKVVLYFGRVEPYKGLDVLLEAFRRVHKALPDWKLVIAGSGDLPASLTQADLAGIEILNRYVPDQEVAGLMQRARMVVLPYTEATQSGVIATAYAFGRPVIATDVGGLNEMVIPGKTGLLIPTNDAGALAHAFRKLARDPGRMRRMGKYALDLSRKEWSWASIAQEHARMYSRVLARHKSR